MFTKKHEHAHESTTKVLYKNAHLIDPASRLEILTNGYLITNGAKIEDFGCETNFGDEKRFDKIVDCKGMLLTPGLIDIQVHFRDPGQTNKEDLISGSKSAVSGGITSVVCQPNTKPTIDNVMVLDYLKYKAEHEAYCNIFTYACITKGMQGVEIADIQEMAEHPIVCGFTDDGLPVMNANLMRSAFEFSKLTGKVIAQHAEDLNLSNKGCMNEGFTSSKLGLRGIPNVSESVIVERDIALLRQFGGRYHVLHVSTKEALDAIKRAKKEGLSVTCEVSPHHLVLTDECIETCGTNAKMNPPLRSKKDIEALQDALCDGTIDAIATDHAPHDFASKEKPMQEATFGIVGVETMLPIALEFYHAGRISLLDLFATMTNRAADVVGIKKGRIEKGSDADLTLIDLHHKWTIDTSKFHSKSKNSPFGGRTVKGRAIKTIVGGVIVYS